MADEAQYSAGADAGGNKRKYDEQTPPPVGTRRATGFSSPDAAPPSYNSVAPPLDGIEMAKQKAQLIAARLNAVAGAAAGAADVKRARVDNGSSGFDSDRGFSSAPLPDLKQASAPSAIPVSYGSYQGTSKRIDIPQMRVGVIIGKAGETIKYLQLQSGAKIQVQRDMDADHNATTRPVELTGTAEQIAKAEQLINDVLAEAEAGGSGIISRRVTGQSGSDHFEMKIPNNKVGLVIGKGGETIKSMQARTGARVQVIPLHLPPGDLSQERTLHIDGTSEQIKLARELVDEVISENRMRNQGMGGGGYPQQGYQARPPANWAPSGAPMQQSGYGYMQPGQYPAPSPQYNMSQPPYPGYPPQPASGGYSSGWDQSGAPQNQQAPAGSGYDYYGQQPSQQQQTPGSSAAPTDNTGYNYGQPPASGYNQQGQGYTQDGYGGYVQPQSGYGQPPQYDQNQGYGAAAGYGNVTNPPQDGSTPSYGAQGDSSQQPVQPSAAGQQAYGASQQPSSNPGGYPPQGAQPGYGAAPASQTGYGSQAPVQPGYGPGYGPPQGQKSMGTPGYGAQQSPSAYGQSAPAQQGYPQPPASGYEQPDPAGQRAAPAGYAAQASKPAYPPAYGAPPAGQPGYAQPPYNSSYGAYQQPPYPADGNATGATQTGQQAAVAKASPQS